MKKLNTVKKILPVAMAAGLVVGGGTITAYAEDVAPAGTAEVTKGSAGDSGTTSTEIKTGNEAVKADNTQSVQDNKVLIDDNKNIVEKNDETAAENSSESIGLKGDAPAPPAEFTGEAPKDDSSNKEYQNQVNSYNTEIDNQKQEIADYNKEIQDYNDTVTEHNSGIDQTVKNTVDGNADTETKGNTEKTKDNDAAIDANNDVVSKTEAEQTKKDILEKPSLGDLSGMTAKEKNDVLDAYNAAVDAYNKAVETYNTDTLNAYKAAIQAYNASVAREAEEDSESADGNKTKAEKNDAAIDSLNTALKDADLASSDKKLAENEIDGSALSAPVLPENFDEMTQEAQKEAIEAYNEKVAAYNEALNSTRGEMDEAYAKYLAAVEAYNNAVQSANEEKTAGNKTAFDANQKAIDSLNTALKDADLASSDKKLAENEIDGSVLSAPKLPENFDEMTPEAQKEAMEAYNEKVAAYNEALKDTSDKLDDAYAKYLEAVKEYNQSVINEQNENNNNTNAANAKELDSALSLIDKIIEQSTGTDKENAEAFKKEAEELLKKLAPEKPVLTGNAETDAQNIKDYNEAVAAYNALISNADKTGYNDKLQTYRDKLAALAEAVKKANAETASQNQAEASTKVSGIDTSLKINTENSANILKKKEDRDTFKTLTEAVEAAESDMKKALDAMNAPGVKADAYKQAIADYNAAIEKCKDAVEKYNDFIRNFNEDDSGIPEGTEQEKKEYSLEKLDKDHTEEAKFFIQITGTVPIEIKNTGYSNQDYISVGSGTVTTGTIYGNTNNATASTEKYVLMAKKPGGNQPGQPNPPKPDDSDGNARVDVPGSNGIISLNEYNNEVINLDHLYTIKDGKEVPLGGTLPEQLKAYYGNVYECIGDAAPSTDAVVKIMYDNDRLDQATYDAYRESVQRGTPSMEVVWYVLKDSNTGTGKNGIHVDGALYFVDTGIIYDSSKFVAITSEFKTLTPLLNDSLEDLKALNPISNNSLKTAAAKDSLTELETLGTKKSPAAKGVLSELTEIDTDDLADADALQELETLDKIPDRYAAPLDSLSDELESLEQIKIREIVVPDDNDHKRPTDDNKDDGKDDGKDDETDIPDEDVPLSPGEEIYDIVDETVPLTDGAEEFIIEEDEVPLAQSPDEYDIPDEEVPLAKLPQTGAPWMEAFSLALAGLGLTLIGAVELRRKSRRDR